MVAISENIESTRSGEQPVPNTDSELYNVWESMTDAYFELDTQWRVTYINSQGERFLHRKREELLGKNLWSEFAAAVDTTFFREYHRAAQDQVAVRFEEFYPPLNTWFEVRAYPSANGLAVYFRDINDLKHGQLVQSYYGAIVQLTEDAIIGVSLPGIITHWNSAAEKLLGYTAAEIIGRAYEELVPTRLREQYHARRQEHLQTGQNFQTERLFVRKDGSEVEVSLRVAFVRDSVGNIAITFAVAHDLTKLKMAQQTRAEELKQTQNELERSLALLRATLEATGDGILVVSQTGEVTHYNQQFVQMWRVPEEMLKASDSQGVIGLAQEQLVDPESFVAGVERMLNDPEAEGYDLLYFKDGRVFERYTKAQRVVDHSVGRVWSFRDVTEQHQSLTAQAELNTQLDYERRRLDEILESVPGIVWEYVFDPAETHGLRLTYTSNYVKKLLGYSKEDGANTVEGWLRIIHPEDHAHLVEHFSSQRADGADSTAQFRVMAKDGSTVWVESHCTVIRDEDGGVCGMRGVTMDITERRAAEAALQRYNDTLEEQVHERTEELAAINRRLREQAMERQVAMGALREAASAHEMARDEADRANMAKSEFLSRMSHELRTPLNAILGFGQILEMDAGTLTSRQSENIQHILKAGRHLLELINEVLDLSRVEAGRINLSMEPVLVREILQESLSLVRPLAENRQIRLDESGTENCDIYVLADRQRLRQVLLNLLSNAIKYNRPNGSVLLECGREEGNLLSIMVKDTGLGIADEDLERLFVPFERLSIREGEIEGTGLGLALSKRLMEVMDGTLEVESRINEGSTFILKLRHAEKPTAVAFPKQSSTTEKTMPTEYHHTVLSIEDNPANSYLIETILSTHAGIQLLQAIQGRMGLELARQHHPDLILLDLHLPDILGDEVLRQLRAAPETQDIPVIVVSADATEQQIKRLLASGARAYHTKPINVKQLLQTIEEILQEKR